jgi:hypothetical protein
MPNQIAQFEYFQHVNHQLAMVQIELVPLAYWTRAETLLVRTPKPSIATEIVDPAGIGPIPAGVPVKITSPGSKVITFVTNSIISGVLKIISEIVADCFTWPFKVAEIF